MQIKGIEGLSVNEIDDELQRGGKFVIYQYCISIIILTFKRNSDVFFIKSGENPVTRGLLYTLISLLIGWWGFPWGPIYTIGTIVTNCRGGKEVILQFNPSSNGVQQNVIE